MAVGYSDFGDFSGAATLYNMILTETVFNRTNKMAYYRINNYVFGNPGTTTTDAEDLELLQIVSDDMLTLSFNFGKTMAMEDPPEFVAYKMPQLTPANKEELDILKMRILTENTKLIYIND